MKFILFYHSLVSDWNHGNAHFLRGCVSELLARGHDVEVYEREDGWSRRNLVEQYGERPLERFAAIFPELTSRLYDPQRIDLDQVLDGADVVIVHEWNEPAFVARVGSHAARSPARLFFHDTHHRSVTDPDSIAALDLRRYHGVLAFGRRVADRYLENGWVDRAWVWHEAADVRRFHPLAGAGREGDLVWIGNWGDDERTAELKEFLIDPVARLGLRARIHGVRYPDTALAALRAANIEYGGWIANHDVPEVFARYGCTVHVPRRAYAQALAGVPTIRVFEALACGIPLICAPWDDEEQLFRPGEDYLVAKDGAQMESHIRSVLDDPALAASLRASALETIRSRHTCAHRVDELLGLIASLSPGDDDQGIGDSQNRALRAACTQRTTHNAEQPLTNHESRITNHDSRTASPDSREPIPSAHQNRALRAACTQRTTDNAEQALPAHGSRLTAHESRDSRLPTPDSPRARGGAPTIAMFGSSLVSAYWNGAATYYRGVIRALHDIGFAATFYEPDAYGRQAHRDIPDPHWARVVVYDATEDGVRAALDEAQAADILIKASGVGVFDEMLEAEVARLAGARRTTIFWDVDAPATLARMRENPADPFIGHVRAYDMILTYGGGPPVVREYARFGARLCVPIYNALDPATHHPVAHDPRFAGDLAFLGNRLPDREARVREFFLEPALRLPEKRFILGGAGWDQNVALTPNVRPVGHVYTRDHNAFNCSPLAVININRDSMANVGYSPPTRVFEAAGAAACLICDAWEGIEQFLDPGAEVLCASSGEEVVELLTELSADAARRIGAAARRRILAQHTYEHRAQELRALLDPKALRKAQPQRSEEVPARVSVH